MAEQPRIRDRLEEFTALRRASNEQNKWLGNGPSVNATSDAIGVVWNPPWIRTLEEFSELEGTTRTKIEHLADSQQAFLRPKFRSDDQEEQMQRAIDDQTADVHRLLKELERMVLTGMAPRDATNTEEVSISANAQKHLSTRLKRLMQAFKSGQEYFGSQLKQREDKLQKYTRFGAENSHQRVQQESRTAAFMEMGYTDTEIQELLLEEAENEQVSKEIKEILAGVKDLYSMLEDLHALVIEQGTVLDRVDYNIQQADLGVRKGLEQLKKAQEHQDSSCVVL